MFWEMELTSSKLKKTHLFIFQEKIFKKTHSEKFLAPSLKNFLHIEEISLTTYFYFSKNT